MGHTMGPLCSGALPPHQVCDRPWGPGSLCQGQHSLLAGGRKQTGLCPGTSLREDRLTRAAHSPLTGTVPRPPNAGHHVHKVLPGDGFRTGWLPGAKGAGGGGSGHSGTRRCRAPVRPGALPGWLASPPCCLTRSFCKKPAKGSRGPYNDLQLGAICNDLKLNVKL